MTGSVWAAFQAVSEAAPSWSCRYDSHGCELVARGPDYAATGIEVRGATAEQVIERIRAHCAARAVLDDYAAEHAAAWRELGDVRGEDLAAAIREALRLAEGRIARSA